MSWVFKKKCLSLVWFNSPQALTMGDSVSQPRTFYVFPCLCAAREMPCHVFAWKTSDDMYILLNEEQKVVLLNFEKQKCHFLEIQGIFTSNNDWFNVSALFWVVGTVMGIQCSQWHSVPIWHFIPTPITVKEGFKTSK